MAQEHAPDSKDQQDDSGEITIGEMVAAEQDPNHPLRDPNNLRHQDFLEAQDVARETLAGAAGLVASRNPLTDLDATMRAMREQLLGSFIPSSLKRTAAETFGIPAAEWKAALRDPTGLADTMRKFSEDLKRRKEWAKPPSFLGVSNLTQSISPNIQSPGFNKFLEIPKPHYRMPLPELNYTAVLDGILSNSSATGLGDAHYQVLERSRQDLARLLKSLDPQDLANDQPHLPSNLRGMVSSRRELEPLLLDEGLALAYVPDAEIIDEILSAPWPRARRDIIGQNWTSITHRCNDLLDSLDDSRLQEYVYFAKRITTALLAGHVEAAQALAANLLDSMLREKRDGKATISKMKRKHRPSLSRGKQITEGIVMAGLWGAFGEYWPGKGDEIPTIFSRHASAHGVSRRQYSQTNAVIALMHVVAYLCWLQYREDVASAA